MSSADSQTVPPAFEAGVDVEQFGALFETFLDRIVHGRERPSALRDLLYAHLGDGAADYSVVVELLEPAERVNLQVALDVYLTGPSRSSNLVGVFSMNRQNEGITFGQILQRDWGTPIIGVAEYSEIDVGAGQVVSCLDYGIHSVTDGDARYVILVSKSAAFNPRVQQRVEVVASTRSIASEVLGELRTLMREHNVYRGKVVRFETNMQLGAVSATVQTLASVRRDELVLPELTLQRIERHVLGFSEHRDALLAAGRHLRRGLLLYGPPGTGKTHTLSYLVGAAPGWTTVIVAGNGFGMLTQAVGLARELQPALVVLEDVDLVAEDRSMHHDGQLPLLFELLNEMDGLDPDADIVFALTTNRVAALEAALVSRPGRVDLAVEIPLPDSDGRRRLINLYGRGLDLRKVDLERIVKQTDGVTASFLRELLRRATLLAAIDGKAPCLSNEHVVAALDELHSTFIGQSSTT